MKRKFVFILIGAAIVIGAGVWLLGQENSPQETSQAPVTALDVTVSDLDENKVNLSEFSGKPLVINSWAVWCPFCVKELSDFATVQKEFSEEVTFIAVNRSESKAKVQEFIQETDVADALVFLLDPDDSFYESIGGFAMPETIFVNADGTIHFHKRGPMDAEEIRSRVQELL